MSVFTIRKFGSGDGHVLLDDYMYGSDYDGPDSEVPETPLGSDHDEDEGVYGEQPSPASPPPGTVLADDLFDATLELHDTPPEGDPAADGEADPVQEEHAAPAAVEENDPIEEDDFKTDFGDDYLYPGDVVNIATVSTEELNHYVGIKNMAQFASEIGSITDADILRSLKLHLSELNHAKPSVDNPVRFRPSDHARHDPTTHSVVAARFAVLVLQAETPQDHGRHRQLGRLVRHELCPFRRKDSLRRQEAGGDFVDDV